MADALTSQPSTRPLAASPVRRRTTRFRRTGGLALTCALVCLLVIAPAVVTTVQVGVEPYELLHTSFPGLDVAVLTAAGQSIADLFAVVTFGALLSALFLRDARGRDAGQLGDVFEMAVLRVSSAGWATVSAAMILLEMLDSSGLPPSQLSEPNAIPFLYEASAFPKAWTVTLIAALLTWIASVFAERWTGLLIPLWASCFGILAPVVVGQILVGPNHDLGGDAGAYQSLLTNAAFGVVLVAIMRVATGRPIAPEIMTRIFWILAVALPVVAASDLLLAWFKLAGTGLLDSVTGWQIIGRWAFLGIFVAAYLGWRVLGKRRLSATWPALAATVGIAGWVGMTAAMTRFPPPQYFVPTSISQVFMGFEVEVPPTVLVLLTNWRPNLLFLLLAIAAVTVYLWAVRNLRSRGDAWPLGRTLSWIAGWGVVVFVTSSGLGKYSAPDFGVHMVVHMSLNMLAPVLLVMGGIATLLLRATRSSPTAPAGVHDWIMWALRWRVLRWIYNPLVIFVLFVGSYYGLYFSGIFGEFMRFHWAHQLMNVHFLIIGYLFYSLVIGVDRPPRPLPHIGKLGFVLAAMPFHAFFGVILMSGGDIIAENFYRNLGLPWADLEASQYFAGGVAWAGGELPLLLVIIALGIQWSRQDAKDARRSDRHQDTGHADDRDAYNQMLEKLAARSAGPRPAPTRTSATERTE